MIKQEEKKENTKGWWQGFINKITNKKYATIKTM